MISHNFSLISNFNGKLDNYQLHEKIAENNLLKNKFLGVCTNNDVVSILFDSDVDEESVSNINNIVDSYTYSEYSEINSQVYIPLEKNNVKYDSYEVIGYYIYLGSNRQTPIKEIKVCSYSSTDQDYSIMILDKTHGVQMAEETFNNRELGINTIKNITDIPTQESIIEVLVKTSNKKYVYINSVVFYS